MLDNFKPDDLQRVSVYVKERFPHVLIEASGGIREQTISLYAGPAVDILSMGSLTHGPEAVDFSLKMNKQT